MYFCDVSPMPLGVTQHFIYVLGEDTIPDIEVQMVYASINPPLHNFRFKVEYKLNKYLIHPFYATQDVEKFSDDDLETIHAKYQENAKKCIAEIRT